MPQGIQSTIQSAQLQTRVTAIHRPRQTDWLTDRQIDWQTDTYVYRWTHATLYGSSQDPLSQDCNDLISRNDWSLSFGQWCHLLRICQEDQKVKPLTETDFFTVAYTIAIEGKSFNNMDFSHTFINVHALVQEMENVIITSELFFSHCFCKHFSFSTIFRIFSKPKVSENEKPDRVLVEI